MAAPALSSLRAHVLLLLLGFGLLAAVAPVLSDYPLEIGFRILLLITLAEAWNLLAGYGGLVSLGTACFFGIGAYGFTVLMNFAGLPIGLAMPLAGLGAALLAALVSRAMFRMRMFMINYNGLGGATGLFLAQDPPGLFELYLIALALLGLTTALMTLLTRSRFSILLRAVRDDGRA